MTILLLLLLIGFMQGIYIYTPETTFLEYAAAAAAAAAAAVKTFYINISCPR
jgi:hypothetical protein